MGMLLSACLPAAAKVYETPAATETIPTPAAVTTVTATPAAAAERTSTLLPTVAKSTIPAGELTPSPEILVIQNDLPGKYLPTIANCQPEDGYYIAENGYSPQPNLEVMSDMGMELGRKYVAETERITGWKVEYLNSTNKQKPRRIVAEAVMHKSPEGAQKALFRYHPILVYPESGWQEMAGKFERDKNQKVYIRKEQAGTAGEFWHIQIEFTYHNYFMKILAEGTPSEMDLSFLHYLVNISHQRLEEEPLFALLPEPTPALPDSEELPTTVKPQDLVLLPADLPEEAGYKSSKYDTQPLQNIEIIRQWGIELGRRYVISTDRKFGWDVSYSSYERRYWVDQVNQAFDRWWDENYEKRLNDDPDYEPFTAPYVYLAKKYPEFIDCQVVQYGSTEGARKALSMTEEKHHPGREGWRVIQGYEPVGDASVIQMNHYVREAGEVYGDLSLTFVYKNYLASVVLTGFDEALNPTFAIDLSNIILAKMKNAK